MTASTIIILIIFYLVLCIMDSDMLVEHPDKD